MENKEKKKDVGITLTKEEIDFCQLYIDGPAPFAGNGSKCHQQIFGTKVPHSKQLAKQLLRRDDIKEYLSSIDIDTYEEVKEMKRFISSTLIGIIEETSTAKYTDRRGTVLSPAPLRSVAVNATKALMDIHPVKEASVNKLQIEGGGEKGIVFNVIMPNQSEEQVKTNNKE